MNYLKAVALVLFLAVASVVGFWIWVLSYFTKDKQPLGGSWDELDFVELHGCWVPISPNPLSSPRSAP